MLKETAIALALMSSVGCVTELELGERQDAVEVMWTSVTNATASGADLTKAGTGGTWNSGAISAQSLSGNGYVEFTTGETSTAKMAGLGVGNTGTNYTDIDYGFYLMAGGAVRIYENGAYRGQFGTYAAGDVFRVEVVGTTVRYSLRGTLVHTSTVAATFPLVLDTALLSTGATIQNAEIADSTVQFWADQRGVAATGTSITKTSGIGWNAGAVTSDTLSGSGYVEFSSSETSANKMAGLSNGNPGTSYQEIDYAFYLQAGGSVRIYENGALRKEVGTYAAGDTFRIEVVNGEVRYLLRGSLVYRSGTAPTLPLSLDTAMYNTGANIQNVTFGSMTGTAVWENPKGVTTTATSLTKTATTAWNAGAVSVRSLSGDGYVEFTSGETTTAKMAGLGNTDSSYYYADIEHAFYLMNGGGIRIYEAGLYRGEFGTYAPGDVFRVAVVGGAVQYSVNGTLVYTSTVAPTFPLAFDSALYTAGSTLQNITFSP